MFGLLHVPFSALTFLALYLQDKNSFLPPLSRAQEQKYLDAAQNGDQEAKKKLVEHNLRLVAHLAKKFSAQPAAQEELVSIGTIGLIKAASGYSGKKDIRFSTYASKCICNEILMHFRASKKYANDISLYDPVETEAASGTVEIIDTLASDYDLEESVFLRIDLLKLRNAMQTISGRGRQVLIRRYGLDGREPATQSEVAAEMSISRSYVSRIEKNALSALRKLLSEE